MFKKVRIFIALVLLFSFTMVNTSQALASSDITPPTIKSIRIDNIAVEPGGNINIEVEAEDLESGISSSNMNRVVQIQKQNGDTYQYVYLDYDSTTKKYTGTYTVPSNSINGEWYISWIYFVDNVGNTESIRPSAGSEFYQSFVVSNGSNDITPPTIKSIKIDKTAVEPGGNINIEVEAEDLESGVSSSSTNRVVQIQKQNGDTYQYVYLNYDSTTKKYTGTYTVPSNSINGEWYISWIYFVDNVGNIESIRPSVGSEFYQSFVVSNGSNDITPPTIKSIRIDNTVVEPGGNINIEVEAEDLESGISSSRTNRVVQIQKQNGDTYQYVYLDYDSTIKKYTGTYTVPTNSINGEWYISWIYFVDNVGNTESIFPSAGSEFYQSFRVTNDLLPPDVPSVDEVTDKSTSVTGTAEAGSLITVKAGTTVLGTSTTTTEGKYSVTIPKQEAGTKLSVTATDGAENTSEAIEVTVKDVTAPLAPQVNAITDKDTVITGTTEANVTVYVKVGSTTIGKGKADPTGKFSVAVPVQKAGTRVSVIVRDGGGNNSLYTTVTVQDKTAPLAPQVNTITDKDTVVTGTAEANVTVYVKVGSTTIGKGKADPTGKFSVAVPVQKAGTRVSVIVRDSGGNNSPYTTVTVQDKTAPLAPQVNAITDKDTVVTGTTEANVTVYVKVGSTTIGKGKADPTGKFSIAVPVQKAGTRVSVIVRDSGGNNSPYTTVTVQDKTAPLAPQVNAITDKDAAVTGTTEANVTVYVKVGSTTIGKGKADPTGKFSVAVPVQKAGTRVSVIVRDSGGNNSPYTVIMVSN